MTQFGDIASEFVVFALLVYFSSPFLFIFFIDGLAAMWDFKYLSNCNSNNCNIIQMQVFLSYYTAVHLSTV